MVESGIENGKYKNENNHFKMKNSQDSALEDMRQCLSKKALAVQIGRMSENRFAGIDLHKLCFLSTFSKSLANVRS